MDEEHDPGSAAAWQRAHDHAWRYFELHAGQRLTVFNFFTVLTGLASAGIAAAIQGDQRFATFGVALGVLLALLAFVFWKLDQRTAFLIKRAEDLQAEAEAELRPSDARLFAGDSAALLEARRDHSLIRQIWTFGSSFRLIFFAAMLFGTVSAVLCGLRSAGVVEWNRAAGSDGSDADASRVASTKIQKGSPSATKSASTKPRNAR